MRKQELGKTPPHDTQPPSDTLEEQLASTLCLAGEALVPDETRESVACTTPVDDRDAPIVQDFDWLKDLVAQFRQALAEDPKRAELLRLLPQGFGNGEILQVLFGNLFPEQRNRRKVLRTPGGKTILTKTQVEILSDTAIGMTPQQIARKRDCTHTNVTGILAGTERRLRTSSPPESVAVAMSMGYLPLDVMGYITAASRAAPRDYSILDSLVSYMGSIQRIVNPVYWQELAAFGLLLMLTTGRATGVEAHAIHRRSASGALYRLERQTDGTYRARQMVAPGLLCEPRGLAIAPIEAQREGFTPGNVFVIHHRATLTGDNGQEIVEFTPEGETVRAFCGGRTYLTHLEGGNGLAFPSSGALLVTSSRALLQFSKGGHSVQRLVDGCCNDSCADRQGNIYLARHSGRGGSIGVYMRHGRLLRAFAQQQPGANFSGVRVSSSGLIVALQAEHGQQKSMLEIYNATGEHLRCWKIEDDSWGQFALDVREDLLFVPIRRTREIQVFSLEGALRQRIALDPAFTPTSAALSDNGSLWVSGVVTNASPQ